ncbi:hypothetical protein ACLOJK_003103 [Asimina triloba]
MGDICTASTFINMWGQFLTRGTPPYIQPSPLPRTKVERPTKPASLPATPPSVKHVADTGDHWFTPHASAMSTSFHITDAQLKQLKSKTTDEIGPFEVISAMFWQCLAKVRGENEPKRVTVCRNDSNAAKGRGILNNKQIISTYETSSYIAGAELSELAALIAGETFDESKDIEAVVESEDGLSDLILYGVNLTFVDLEDVNCYGLEVKGHKLASVHFSLDGVGSEGAVLVMPRLPTSEQGWAQGGRKVTVILPENQVSQLRNELQLAGIW